MVKKNMENGILIKIMAVLRRKMQMVPLIGGNAKILTRKNMEHSILQMETDTSVNSWVMSSTAMEYTDGLKDQYTTENTKRIISMVTDIWDGQMAMNIAENGRTISNRERESKKKKVNYTQLNMKKASCRAVVNYRRLMSRNECY
jgi:F0F1-type ATP synthase beta subunit